MGFESCGPNEVMVISGCFLSRARYVTSGRVYVWPKLQKIQRLSLNKMILTVQSPTVSTKLGEEFSVTGIAEVAIRPGNQEILEIACQQFLGKSEQDIANAALETLQGHQRAVMSSMLLEEIYRDRIKFSDAVKELAAISCLNMGIFLVDYTLQDLNIHTPTDFEVNLEVK